MALRSLTGSTEGNISRWPHRSWCILGLYVKPTWRPPAPERFVRSAGIFWSLRPPVGPVPSPTWWAVSAHTGPGGRTVPAGPGSAPNCCPHCGEEEAGCSAVPFCSVEVWVYIRLWSTVSSSTWPRKRARWVRSTWPLFGRTVSPVRGVPAVSGGRFPLTAVT